MTRLIRAELLKLATTRLTYGLAITAAGLTALFSLLENNRAGVSGTGVPSISTPDGLSTVTTVTGFAMLFAAVLQHDGQFTIIRWRMVMLDRSLRGRVDQFCYFH